MPQHVIIDGNNLLHAMHAYAPLPTVGRETLVRIIERWARSSDDDVTLVFDGPSPRGGLGQQMTSSRISVRFAAPASADEVIETLVGSAKHPDRVRVISSDTALRSAAKRRRCLHTSSVSFVAELFPTDEAQNRKPKLEAEKPSGGLGETEDWLEWFGLGKEGQSDGSNDPDSFGT